MYDTSMRNNFSVLRGAPVSITAAQLLYSCCNSSNATLVGTFPTTQAPAVVGYLNKYPSSLEGISGARAAFPGRMTFVEPARLSTQQLLLVVHHDGDASPIRCDDTHISTYSSEGERDLQSTLKDLVRLILLLIGRS